MDSNHRPHAWEPGSQENSTAVIEDPGFRETRERLKTGACLDHDQILNHSLIRFSPGLSFRAMPSIKDARSGQRKKRQSHSLKVLFPWKISPALAPLLRSGELERTPSIAEVPVLNQERRGTRKWSHAMNPIRSNRSLRCDACRGHGVNLLCLR